MNLSHSLFLPIQSELSYLDLNRDLTKHLKRGHRWIYASAVLESKQRSTPFVFISYKKEILGLGFHQPESLLRFRMFCLKEEVFFNKNNPNKTLAQWSDHQWQKALSLRKSINLSETNSFRLVNGEGDGLPGLVIDIYADTAVVKFDNSEIESIYNKNELSQRLRKHFPSLQTIYLKRRHSEKNKGEILYGNLKEETQFKENNLNFTANIRDGSKTGFFLDQRDSRQLIRQFSKGLEVLNLFCYTGGFSIYAAAGGASKVTSVDIAKQAIESVEKNYDLNNLKCKTQNMALDAFEFVSQSLNSKIHFDMVITDPPSFAPNEKSIPQATAAYIKIFSESLKLVRPNGFFAASSCSSHISTSAFLEITKESFSKAKLRGTLIYFGGQPFDHPYPLAMDELRYLKFALFRLD